MFNWLKELFRTPKVGEVWIRDNPDPFAPVATAKILEVKDGWVLYKHSEMDHHLPTRTISDFKYTWTFKE